MTTPRILDWRTDTYGLLHARIEAPVIRRRRLAWPWVPTNLRVVVRRTAPVGVWQATRVGVYGHRPWGRRITASDSWGRERGAAGGAWDLTHDGDPRRPHPMPPWLLPLVDELVCEWLEARQ